MWTYPSVLTNFNTGPNHAEGPDGYTRSNGSGGVNDSRGVNQLGLLRSSAHYFCARDELTVDFGFAFKGPNVALMTNIGSF